jgi:hypothetical protein
VCQGNLWSIGKFHHNSAGKMVDQDSLSDEMSEDTIKLNTSKLGTKE